MSAERSRSELSQLTHSDWLVLGALGSGATHGFAIARSLDKDGDLGRIWSVRRPMVYQSVSKLIALGLVVEGASERSMSGPTRTPLTLTEAGCHALEEWLISPVAHLREMRPLLLAKLIVLRRREADPSALLEAQRVHVEEMLEGVTAEADDDVATLVEAWRRHSALAMLAFLDEQQSSPGWIDARRNSQ